MVEVQAHVSSKENMMVIRRPQSSLQRNRNQHLFCRDCSGAKLQCYDAGKTMANSAP
jgi:hypothetical protein